MINDKEVLRLKNTNSVLEAVKYVKNASGLSLTDCKKYVDNLIDNTPLNTGTITWISVDKELPPAWGDKEENPFGYSEDVLVFNRKTKKWYKDSYCHSKECWQFSNRREISHWAKINLPE